MYDLVAMIGAIGGTLGLCIGISLKDMTRVLLRFLEQLRKKVQRQVGNRKKRLSKDILVDKKIQQSKSICQQVVNNDHSIRSFDKIYSLEIFRILP